MTTTEMAYRSETPEIDERNALVMEELPQVYYIAARIHERLPQHVEVEDLVHAGVLGLLDAWRNFDVGKNAQFKTFAKFRIRGAILDSLRLLDWGSRGLRKKAREIADTTALLEKRLGRGPSKEEIAGEMKITLDQLEAAMMQLDGLQIVGQQAASSYDRDEVLDLIEGAEGKGDDNPFDLCASAEMQGHLAAAVARLSEREQLILSLYYKEELTMKEVAGVVGIALSRVSQVHCAAISKLRAALAHLDRPALFTPQTSARQPN